LRLQPNKPYQFNVEAFDQANKKMSTIGVRWIKWTCDRGGEISDNGIFTGNLQEEEAVITARLNNVTDSVTIKLLPILSSIEISPNYRTIEPHQSIQFSAKGFDQFQREFSLDNLQWYADEGIINNDGYYRGLDYENEVTITAKSGEIKSSIILTIRDRSRLTRIKISPEYITINPNGSYQFFVIGLDQRNERISIDHNIDNIEWNVDEGYINNSGLYSTDEDQQGYYYITAKIENFTAQATVYIPRIIRSLNISPQNISLNPEEECQFILQGFDQQNNLVNISNADWRCEFGGNINNRGIFTGGYQRKQVKVTAIVDGVKAETVVTILPVLRRLEITP
ncbi:hypothetical protein ACN4EE_23720, partial [Geminocystis sp. CENA526]|uniref:hypothetical protein n=1 Tax=Geminocystis sp. CENA526 TaxID=1355871 RepID=UPI003D6FC696